MPNLEMIKPFNKSEIKSIILIFVSLLLITSINIFASLRKSRDVTRKNDMGAIQEAVNIYHQKYKVYPLSTNSLPDGKAGGKIIGCFEGGPDIDKITKYPVNAIPCEWDKSSFENIVLMPKDPNYDKGVSYLYVSDGEKYELYVSLEGKHEAEYSKAVVEKNLQCGNEICNYGRWVN